MLSRFAVLGPVRGLEFSVWVLCLLPSSSACTEKELKSYRFVPPHDKTNEMACAPSEDSDQPGQSDQSSLCAQWVAKGQSFLHAESENSDQTGRMPRLI